MAELRAAGKLAKGTRGTLSGRGIKNPARDVPTLEELGVDKNLAKAARKLAAMSEEEFAATVAKAI